MIKNLIYAWSLAAILMLLPATSALAAPVTYDFTSGSVTLRVTDVTTGLSVLTGPSSITLPLIGSQVVFDQTASTYGRLISLEINPISPFVLNLDPSVAGFQSVSVANASLVEAAGAFADLTSQGSFQIDTLTSGDVTGTFPDLTTVGPIPYTSGTNASETTGSLGLNGNQLMLGINGINLAIFDTVTNPGGGDILVKADFIFISTVVPEPGTALLLGLGLVGLSTATARKRR